MKQWAQRQTAAPCTRWSLCCINPYLHLKCESQVSLHPLALALVCIFQPPAPALTLPSTMLRHTCSLLRLPTHQPLPPAHSPVPINFPSLTEDPALPDPTHLLSPYNSPHSLTSNPTPPTCCPRRTSPPPPRRPHPLAVRWLSEGHVVLRRRLSPAVVRILHHSADVRAVVSSVEVGVKRGKKPVPANARQISTHGSRLQA